MYSPAGAECVVRLNQRGCDGWGRIHLESPLLSRRHQLRSKTGLGKKNESAKRVWSVSSTPMPRCFNAVNTFQVVKEKGQNEG